MCTNRLPTSSLAVVSNCAILVHRLDGDVWYTTFRYIILTYKYRTNLDNRVVISGEKVLNVTFGTLRLIGGVTFGTVEKVVCIINFL